MLSFPCIFSYFHLNYYNTSHSDKECFMMLFQLKLLTTESLPTLRSFSRSMSQVVDSHVSVYVTFPVPEHVDFKSSIPKFYEITKQSTKDLIYYGYAENGNSLMVQVSTLSSTGCSCENAHYLCKACPIKMYLLFSFKSFRKVIKMQKLSWIILAR